MILAACYSNPFHNVNSLTELYKKVLTDHVGSSDSADRDDASVNLKATISKNNMSLNFTTNASIKLLEESAPSCLNLLYFLGCLPGGVLHDQLKEMWTDVDESLKILDDMSLLEQGEEKVVLTTHLIKYVELSIDEDSKANYISQISEYYTSLLSEFYRTNSRVESCEDSEGAQSQKVDSTLSPMFPERKGQQKNSFKDLI